MVRSHHILNGLKFEQILGEVEERGAWHAAVHELAKNWT